VETFTSAFGFTLRTTDMIGLLFGLLVAAALLALPGPGAAAPMSQQSPNAPPDMRLAPVLMTDADADRAGRLASQQQPSVADDLAKQFGVQDGKVELFRADGYDMRHDRGFSAGFDADGASVHLRW
jgi:hypothetical protein